jgi:hypothetical protein
VQGITSAIPYQYHLEKGSCSNLVSVALGSIESNEDNLYYFKFSDLDTTSTYFFSFQGDEGSGFELDGVLIEVMGVQLPNTCSTTVCNLIQNPGFEQAELQFSNINPIGNAVVGGCFCFCRPSLRLGFTCRNQQYP